MEQPVPDAAVAVVVDTVAVHTLVVKVKVKARSPDHVQDS